MQRLDRVRLASDQVRCPVLRSTLVQLSWALGRKTSPVVLDRLDVLLDQCIEAPESRGRLAAVTQALGRLGAGEPGKAWGRRLADYLFFSGGDGVSEVFSLLEQLIAIQPSEAP